MTRISKALPHTHSALEHLCRHIASADPVFAGAIVKWGGFRPDDSDEFAEYSQGTVAVCMEAPAIGRGQFVIDGSADPDTSYYRLAVDDATVLNPGFGIPSTASCERIECIFDRLHLSMKPWRADHPGRMIVYAMAHPGNASLRGLDVFEAAHWDLTVLSRRSSRRVVITHHPTLGLTGLRDDLGRDCSMAFDRLASYARSLGYLMTDPSVCTADYLDDAHAVVCNTSLVAFDALLAGVPVVALHSGNFHAPICASSAWNIEAPERPDRMAWWARLAYSQWSWAEIASGVAATHLAEVVSRYPLARVVKPGTSR